MAEYAWDKTRQMVPVGSVVEQLRAQQDLEESEVRVDVSSMLPARAGWRVEMVKVIKRKPAKEVAKRVVCRGCGSTLEYVPNEVKERHGTDCTGGPAGEEWVDCPECGKKAIIRCW